MKLTIYYSPYILRDYSLAPVSVAGQRVPHAPEGGTEQVVQLLRVAHARQTRPVHNPPWGVNI